MKKVCKICDGIMEHRRDWFMVNNELWREVCGRLGVSTREVICTKCFEAALGRSIEVGDLKTGSNDRELPINFWVIKKYKARERVKNIEQNIQYLQELMASGVKFKGINSEKLVEESKKLIGELELP